MSRKETNKTHNKLSTPSESGLQALSADEARKRVMLLDPTGEAFDELTPRQQLAVRVLLVPGNYWTDAAAACNCRVSTLTTDPTLAAYMRSVAMADIRGPLFVSALATIQELMTSPRVRPTVRLKAAQMVLDREKLDGSRMAGQTAEQPRDADQQRPLSPAELAKAIADNQAALSDLKRTLRSVPDPDANSVIDI